MPHPLKLWNSAHYYPDNLNKSEAHEDNCLFAIPAAVGASQNHAAYSKGGMVPSSDQKVNHICTIPPLPPAMFWVTPRTWINIDLKEKYNKISPVRNTTQAICFEIILHSYYWKYMGYNNNVTVWLSASNYLWVNHTVSKEMPEYNNSNELCSFANVAFETQFQALLYKTCYFENVLFYWFDTRLDWHLNSWTPQIYRRTI